MLRLWFPVHLRRRLLGLAVCIACLPAWAASPSSISFIGVALDPETRQADQKLQRLLKDRTGLSFAPEEWEYAQVIQRIAQWQDQEGAYVARMTPYVYLVAEMMGARMEILGTYVDSAEGRSTYRAHFVVPKSRFSKVPDFQTVLKALKDDPRPWVFAFHNSFSTSSYFLPSLLFRQHQIFHAERSEGSLRAIRCLPIQENSSQRLVERVAFGEADLASVWDGTRRRFPAGNPTADRVHFVELPGSLPNDLLVCSANLPGDDKGRLREAVRSMSPGAVSIGDFESWIDISQAGEARQALADLRWKARHILAPVTLKVEGRVSESLLEAARQAIRLSGTEFCSFDEDFHEHLDCRWRLEPIHDGAIRLTSTFPGVPLPEQRFHLSFLHPEDLTQRLVQLLQARIHRIRTIWPHSSTVPMIFRDTPRAFPEGSPVVLQKIAWLDPERNAFRAGPSISAKLKAPNPFFYEIDPATFKLMGEESPRFDPMSHLMVRAYMIREDREPRFLPWLTAAWTGLIMLGGLWGGWRLKRELSRPS